MTWYHPISWDGKRQGQSLFRTRKKGTPDTKKLKGSKGEVDVNVIQEDSQVNPLLHFLSITCQSEWREEKEGGSAFYSISWTKNLLSEVLQELFLSLFLKKTQEKSLLFNKWCSRVSSPFDWKHAVSKSTQSAFHDDPHLIWRHE